MAELKATNCGIVNTAAITTYKPIDTYYNVTAGAGQFNGSFVKSTLDNNNGSLTYFTLVSAYNFVTNPVFSALAPSIVCLERSCESYIFPGAI